MGNETALAWAVATVGPIAVSIHADMPTLRHYKSGVYYNPHCDKIHLDHAVLVCPSHTNEWYLLMVMNC